MKNMKSWAIAVLVLGLISLALGIIVRFTGANVAGLSPRALGLGAGLCFVFSINLLLLEDKKP